MKSTLGVRILQPVQSWIVNALEDLVAYAHSQGLHAVHQPLADAKGKIELLDQDQTISSPDCTSEWFSDALDALIEHCRRVNSDEVLDHLLEARMAWDERQDGVPDGNVLAFRSLP
jgi:hypothetical protein